MGHVRWTKKGDTTNICSCFVAAGVPNKISLPGVRSWPAERKGMEIFVSFAGYTIYCYQ